MKYLLIVFSSVFFWGSCSQSNKKSEATLHQGMLTTDQSEISYSDCGSGEITLFFVHGWNINQSYWTAQFDHFCENYQLVAMDLPGFGASKNLSKQYSIAAYAADISALVNHLNLKKVVLVGHSMGGRLILEAAQKNERIIAMVGIDNFKEVNQTLTEEVKQETDGFLDMLKNDFQGVSAAYADQYLIHEDADSLVRRRIVEDYTNANPENSMAAIEAYFNYQYSESERLANLKLPLYLISSNMFPLDTLALDQTGLEYQIYGMVKTGHFPMVEQPEAFNKCLADVLIAIKGTLD